VAARGFTCSALRDEIATAGMVVLDSGGAGGGCGSSFSVFHAK